MIKKWTKIKKEYLEGAKPKDLAKKYGTTSSAIRSKASKEKWSIAKEAISDNVQQDIEQRIKGLTNKALNTCESVLDDDNAKYQDKLNAAKIIVDISGLKKETNNNNNKNFNFDAPVDDKTMENVINKLKNF